MASSERYVPRNVNAQGIADDDDIGLFLTEHDVNFGLDWFSHGLSKNAASNEGLGQVRDEGSRLENPSPLMKFVDDNQGSGDQTMPKRGKDGDEGAFAFSLQEKRLLTMDPVSQKRELRPRREKTKDLTAAGDDLQADYSNAPPSLSDNGLINQASSTDQSLAATSATALVASISIRTEPSMSRGAKKRQRATSALDDTSSAAPDAKVAKLFCSDSRRHMLCRPFNHIIC